MKKILFFLPAILIAGCETFNNSSKNEYYTRKQYETSRAQEQQVAQLAASVTALNASNTEIIRNINEINQKILVLQQNHSSLQSGLNTLRQDIDTTKKTWQNTNQKMIDQISSEMGSIAKRASSSGASQQGPTGTGEFFEHKVEPGSTLNAIAKAYGVSVQEIRAANKMSSDIIRVGQILYIPKK
jgi:LysM repeat protein